MSFFVVERDPTDGTLRMLLADAFPDRSAALAALTDSVADGTATIAGEVFVADLALAVPVLVMPAPSTPKPTSGSWETPVPEPVSVEPDDADETLYTTLTDDELLSTVPAAAGEELPVIADAEEVVEAWNAAVTPPPPAVEEDAAPGIFDDLENALRRATASLESEGVVAPDAIDDVEPDEPDEPAGLETPIEAPAEDVEESWPWSSVAADDTEVVSADEPDQEPAPVEDIDHGPVTGIAEPLGVASEPIPAAPEPADAPTDDEDALFASLGDASDEHSSLIVTTAVEGEDAFLPKPVILGDYDDAPEAPVIAPALTEDAPMTDPVLEEPASVPVASPEEVVAYVPAGDLDLGEYTCDDCVYVNTCPKVGESSPKECGSFQWKSD
ncbi:MAG: hypothetical protein Q7W44_03545 [Coriobacteriia bacterium]|nr:hypothetical protein [Coriobacteriia bacterium]